MKRKSPRTYQESYSPSPRSTKQILYYTHCVNLKKAKEKLETGLLFISKMSTFVSETSFQFKV